MPPASFNFKQRLAALSLPQSGPSSPHDNGFSSRTHGNAGNDYTSSPTSPNTKRKMTFNAPSWLKKTSGMSSSHAYNRGIPHGEEEKRMVQDVLAKMIFQAGVDFETRPMVVLNASALPDPQAVSYDLLLSRILSYLDLYVEADYTVVFFAAGSKHAPSWNWVWKAYRSLSRKYRKNLKQLYIVHSSFFSKMLFSLAGAIISPKFFRKLMYITTLSELARHVPLTQIDIPPAVYQENLKFERQITMPVPTRSNVFGVPLEDLMGYDGEKGGIPRVVKDAIHFLRESGMQEEGLFRRSPSSSLLRAAQEAYDRGNVVSLDSFGDPHLAAVLLKKFLRDLPEPIFPESIYGVIKRCPVPSGAAGYDESEEASIHYLRHVLLPELVPCAYILLSQILHLLHDVAARSEYNKMGSTNLAIVICPNLVKSSNPMRDVMMCSVTGQNRPNLAALAQSRSEQDQSTMELGEGKATLGIVIDLCIRRYYEIFDEVVDRSEAVAPWRALRSRDATFDARSSGSGGSQQPTYVLGDGEEEEDEDDDDALVMPISDSTTGHANSAWVGHTSTIYHPPHHGTSSKTHGTTKRHRSNTSNGSKVISSQSLFNDGSTSSPSAWSGTVRASPFAPNGKAKSVISVDGSGDGVLGTGTLRKGSISIGRGTTRKASGAAVEAVGVTAEGFFAPPADAPPVPRVKPPVPPKPQSIPDTSRRSSSSDVAEEQEEPRVSVGDRRRMFEDAAGK